jgi:dephospho-CoA kinase
MFADKPIIGLTGGIGSGKSFVAQLFGEEGCLVINSDDLVRQAYKDTVVKFEIKKWWGKLVFDPNGDVDRAAVARKVFQYPSERQKLENLLHPIVDRTREKLMRMAAENPETKAYVWDTPLLFETHLNERCDSVVFVDAPIEARLQRVSANRGWDRAELDRRENLQISLDKKREIADYVVVNTADAEFARGQVREVLSQVLAGATKKPVAGGST